MKRQILTVLFVWITILSSAQEHLSPAFSVQKPSVSLSYSMFMSYHGGALPSPYIPLKMSGGFDVGIFPLNVRIGMQKDPRYYLQTSLGITFTNYVLKDESYTRVIHLPEGEIREETIYNSNRTKSNRSIGFFNVRIPVKFVASPTWMKDYYLGVGYEGQIHLGSYYRVKTQNDCETVKDITNNTDAVVVSFGKRNRWELFFEYMRTPVPANFLFKNYGTIACACTDVQCGMKFAIPNIKLK